MADRRQRIHELVLALLAQQGDLDLLRDDGAATDLGSPDGSHHLGEAMKRSRQVIRRYQALVRSAVTLDALIDQELAGQPLPASMTGSGEGRSD
ncbi:MAG: hypothetical protein VKO44_04555 [Cyanobacteriota bacterium]|jgi:hypothetical protein|nr:hypothetical protein [Cyanobacteriota bacterium]